MIGGAMGRLREDLAGLRAFSTGLHLWGLPPLSPERREGLERYSDEIYGLCLRVIALTFIVGSFVLWPLDGVVLQSIAPTIPLFDAWRGGMVACFVVMYALHALLRAYRWRAVRRLGMLACVGAILSLSGTFVGHLGGLDHSFVYAILGQAGAHIAAFLPLGLRVITVGVLNLSFLIGFFVVRPEALHHPDLVPLAIVLGTANLLYLIPGHVSWALVRRGWLQRADLTDRSRELQAATDLNAHLLLTALPLEISRRLAARRGALTEGLKEVAVLIYEPLGPWEGAAEGAWGDVDRRLTAVDAWLTDACASRGLPRLDALGRSGVVVAGLQAPSGGMSDLDALKALGADLLAAAKGRADLDLGIFIDLGQVLVGEEAGAPWLYDPWGALLAAEPPWHRAPGGGILLGAAVAARVGREGEAA